MKFEPTNYRFETGSFQIWALFEDHSAAPVARAYKRAVDAARDADDYANGLKSCGYDMSRIVSFLICKVDVKEIARLRKKIVPEFKIRNPHKKENASRYDRED